LIENLVDSNSMIRKDVHQFVGGYSETNRNGLEDYEFWLCCANFGYWGGTIPDYLNWYRRRNVKLSDRWVNLSAERRRSFLTNLHKKYPKLWEGNFPNISPRFDNNSEDVLDDLPCENRLRKNIPRMLVLSDSLNEDRINKFNHNLVKQITHNGWEITIAISSEKNTQSYSKLGQHTPDIFILNQFIRNSDYPRFLRYLINSRNVDVVLIHNSILGYRLLPYFRFHFPELILIDYIHEGNKIAEIDNCYELGVNYQKFLNLNIVSSEDLKSHMIQAGADSHKIESFHTNLDIEKIGEKMIISIEKASQLNPSYEVLNTNASIDIKQSASLAIEHLTQLKLKEWYYQMVREINSEQQDQFLESNKFIAFIKEISDNPYNLAILNFLFQRHEYLDEQMNNWQKLAEGWGTMVWELKEWIEDRERALKWWQSQSANWQRKAEERNDILKILSWKLRQYLNNLYNILNLKRK